MKTSFSPWLAWASLAVLTVACSSSASEENAAPTPEPPPVHAAPQVAPPAPPVPALPAPKLSWQTELDAAMALAKSQNKYLFIDVTAQWCKACKELDTQTFPDPKLATLLSEKFVLLKIDVTEQNAADKAVMKRFGVPSLPALLALQGDAVFLQINRFVGPADLESHLRNLPVMPSATSSLK